MRAAGLVLLLALAPRPAPAAPPPDPEAALRQGNRLYRRGEVAAAVEAYRRGTAGRQTDDPVLAYNLGTALHRLGRLPEAVLWYRRAAAAGSSDPWLADNLARARREVGAPRVGPPPLLAPLLRHRWIADVLAAVLAWGALLAALTRPRRRHAAGALLAASLASWGGGLALRHLGPEPAVLLAPCTDRLPAGSEVWVTRERSGAFRVIGGATPCPAGSVGTVAAP